MLLLSAQQKITLVVSKYFILYFSYICFYELTITIVDVDYHSNLLVDPVTLPEMSHLDIPSLNAEKSRVFYETGEKNSTLSRQIDITFRNTHPIDVTPDIKVVRSKAKPKRELVITKPKEKLFYGKKADKATEDMIASIRKNEAKFKAKVTTVT
jgi:hypothetical protein